MFGAWLMLLAIAASAAGQELHGLGSDIKVECSSAAQPLYFKLMKRFTIVLVPSHISVEVTLQAKGSAQCTLSNQSPICDFEQAETELSLTCSAQSEIVLSVARPEMLGTDQKLTSRFVELSQQNFERGVISVLIEGDLETEVRQRYAAVDVGQQIFYSSKCVKSIALFEDHFRIAVQRSPEVCILGLKRHIDARWSYQRGPSDINISKKHYEDYCQKNGKQTYSLPSSTNFTMELLVETDIDKVLNELQMTVAFHQEGQPDHIFHLSNYEKGIDPYLSKLHCDRPADSFTISSNLDIFFMFSFEPTKDNYFGLEQDEYLYTSFRNGFQFTIELDNFDEQNATQKQVSLFASAEAPANFKLKFAECVDFDCTLPGPFQPVVGGKFTPKCANLSQQMCAIKIAVETTEEKLFGLVAHVNLEHEEIEVNRYHHGTLSKGAISKYIIKKEVLQKANDEFLVMAQDVHVYLTYDPECRRISCCLYDVKSGYKEIPNERKDIYIFLKGTNKIKYHFLIDLKDNSSFVLSDGTLVKSQMAAHDNFKYFTYHVSDSTKKIEINCNSPTGTVKLLLSKTKTFDFELESNILKSAGGYIMIPPGSAKNGSNLHIAIQRQQNHPGNIDFTIVAYAQGSEIILDYSTPYYDYLSGNTAKLFAFHVFLPQLDDRGVAFKVDIPESLLKQDHHVNISFGDGQKEAVTWSEWDLRTALLGKETLKQICGEANAEKICKIVVTLKNTGQTPLEIDLLVWIRQHPVMLYDGHFINFDTGALEDETHFYFDIVDKNKPINFYISSTQVQIEVEWVMFTPEEGQQLPAYPFPTLNRDDRPSRKAFSYSAYIDPESIRKSAEADAKRLMVLITVKDQSRKLNRETVFEKSLYAASMGSIQLIYTSGQVEMREDDKLEYYLGKNETIYLTYDLSGMLSDNSTKQEIELYNTPLMGNGEFTISYYLTEDNMQFGTEVNTTGDVHVVPVKFDVLRRQVKQLNLTKVYKLVFMIHSKNFTGRHVCNIVTSYSEYRELTLGVPEEFRIKPSGSAIFEFADAYNKEFKIKINRREGFPDYKIISCSTLEDIATCFHQLDRRNLTENDPSRIVVGGRSHELVINSKSEVYCKRCRYYIAFYAESEDVQGSVTVLRSNQTVNLLEGRTLTTEVYGQEMDMYKIGVEPHKTTMVRVTAYTGDVTVTILAEVPLSLEDQYQLGRATRLEVAEEVVVAANKSVQLNVKTLKRVFDERTITVKTKDSTNAMYTIFYASESFPVILEDGMPIHINREEKGKNLTNNFQFFASAKATLIVMSPAVINISLECPEQKKQVTVGSLAPSTTADSDLLSHIEHSPLWNITAVTLDPEICKRYVIRMEGQEQVDYTIVVSGIDIVFLPVDQMIPGRLLRGGSRTYEVPIAQSTHLKISMRLCTRGQVNVGLAYDKSDLKQGDYDNTFEISMEQDYQVYTHKARPGILYIVVKSVNRDIDYTLQVVNFRGKQLQEPLIYLEDPSLHHKFAGVLTPATSTNSSLTEKAKTAVSKILAAGKQFSYDLEFTPLKIESSYVDYTVTYVVVESRSKSTLESFVRCRGMFFGEIINEQMKVSAKEVLKIADEKSPAGKASPPQKISYQSKFETSYISIVPIVSPQLPTHVTFETYRIVRLSGPSSNPFVIAYHGVVAIYSFFEAHTPFQNTWHLYLLTTSVVLLILIVTYFVVGGLAVCIAYQFQTYAYRKRSRPLAQSEYEARQPQAGQDSSLDMTERETSAATLSLPEGDNPSQLV